MRLELAMIVRDAETSIERCLNSIRPFVDRVAIYLAGESTDATVAILARIAAEPGPPVDVVQGEWRDDFAWARNRSFELVPDADWVMWLDADDELIGGEGLRDAIVAHSDADAVEMSYRLPHGGDFGVGNPVRVVRQGAGWSWESPLHEQLVCGNATPTTVRLPVDQPPLVVHRRETTENAERNLRIVRAHPELGLSELARAVGALNYPGPLNPPATTPCAACPWVARGAPADELRKLWERQAGLGEGDRMACPHEIEEHEGRSVARACRGAVALQQRAVLRWMAASDPKSGIGPGLEPFRPPVWERVAFAKKTAYTRDPTQEELDGLRVKAPLRIIADALGEKARGHVSGVQVVAAMLPDVLDASISCEQVPAPTPAELVEWRAAGLGRKTAP